MATGLGTQEEVDNLSDDISETGWETDLDLEGLWTRHVKGGGKL